jgi:hypothetical protein
MWRPGEQIFDTAAVRAALDKEPWEDDDHDESQQQRAIYIGTIYALTPSGKFYAPFACSNVEPCPHCHGDGSVNRARRRVQKRAASRLARQRAKAERLRRQGVCDLRGRFPNFKKSSRLAYGETCRFCKSMGSIEALRDEQWREQAEKELEAIGCCLINGEGSSDDLFVMEYRDVEVEEDDDAVGWSPDMMVPNG